MSSPSTIPSPLRKMGTMTIFPVVSTVTGYSKPSGETSVPWVEVLSVLSSADEARRSVSSCTRDFVSFVLVFAERSCESLACTQGCLETVTCDGRDDIVAAAGGMW